MFQYQPPVFPWLSILWRDDDYVVLDKPAGLLTVPGKAPEHQDSLEKRVQTVLPTARIVHRLDMATSGIVVMALNKEAHGRLGQQFEQRRVEKQYKARIWGVLLQSEGMVDLPLRCDWPNRPRQMVCYTHGKSAQTRYKRLASSTHCTDVLLYPITGRSHQLRVHMLALGHPILGDRLYGTAESQQAAARLLLHAESIAFTHPRSQVRIHINCPAPF